MTRLAVVAYPAIVDPDLRWIESVRAKHDPQAGLIRAHFTLVFPTEADPEIVAREASAACDGTAPIGFVMRRVEPVRDFLGVGGHVFLVPGQGYVELVALHARLHGGVLREQLRDDLPFVPHVTVGAKDTLDACGALADMLNREGRSISGLVNRLDLIAVGPSQVQPLAFFTLAG